MKTISKRASKIKTRRILANVTKLAQQYPDFVYQKGGELVCRYNSGGDANYPQLLGCIVGQAARSAGFDTSAWDGPMSSVKAIIRRELKEDCNSQLAEKLILIQKDQDEGTPWGECITKAGMQQK